MVDDGQHIIALDQPELGEIEMWTNLLRRLEAEIRYTANRRITKRRCPVYWYARGMLPRLPPNCYTRACVHNKVKDRIKELKKRHGITTRKKRLDRSGWDEAVAHYEHTPTRLGLFPHRLRVRYHYRDVARRKAGTSV